MNLKRVWSPGAPLRKPITSTYLMEQVIDVFKWPLRHTRRVDQFKLLERVILIAVAIWASLNMAALLWTLWPAAPFAAQTQNVVNPPVAQVSGTEKMEVDLDAMMGRGLFGEPLGALDSVPVAEPNAALPEGIEAEARETRLDLILVGTLAESGSDLGTAVIEIKGLQRPFRVGDDLPVNGSVSLAKVLPERVVLDNNGTYELLRLFDDSGATFRVDRSGSPTFPKSNSAGARPGRPVTFSRGEQIAATYRQQLYENPEALADLVQVQAVQGPSGLRGYRVSPGKDAKEFEALGFEAGDVITAVNDLPLSDPANGVRLYGLMREAPEARFTIERNGAELTLSVGLQPELQER